MGLSHHCTGHMALQNIVQKRDLEIILHENFEIHTLSNTSKRDINCNFDLFYLIISLKYTMHSNCCGLKPFYIYIFYFLTKSKQKSSLILSQKEAC